MDPRGRAGVLGPSVWSFSCFALVLPHVFETGMFSNGFEFHLHIFFEGFLQWKKRGREIRHVLLRQSRLPYRACQVRLAIPYSHVRNNLTL
jgi:hypothetical protein